MSDTVLVEVIAGTTNTMTVDVQVPTAQPIAIDVTADGFGAVGYPQLPIELQQLPIAIPIAGRPPVSGTVNVSLAFAVTVPALLAGTTVYAATKTSANASFRVNKISGVTTTEIGKVTFTPTTSNTSCLLEGIGGTLAIGDVLQVISPAAPDNTLADIGITILVNRV
jgi:hypothetical protein